MFVCFFCLFLRSDPCKLSPVCFLFGWNFRKLYLKIRGRGKQIGLLSDISLLKWLQHLGLDLAEDRHPELVPETHVLELLTIASQDVL